MLRNVCVIHSDMHFLTQSCKREVNVMSLCISVIWALCRKDRFLWFDLHNNMRDNIVLCNCVICIIIYYHFCWSDWFNLFWIHTFFFVYRLLYYICYTYRAKIFINQVKYKIPTNEDREKSIMTSLGKLVFGDIHERYMKDFSKKSLTQDDSSVEHADSLSLAYENLLYMPLDIIERHGITVNTLDVSYNKFSR